MKEDTSFTNILDAEWILVDAWHLFFVTGPMHCFETDTKTNHLDDIKSMHRTRLEHEHSQARPACPYQDQA